MLFGSFEQVYWFPLTPGVVSEAIILRTLDITFLTGETSSVSLFSPQIYLYSTAEGLKR